ncbi:MAG: cation:proton antiporter [Candidatus Abyssobacteria bacterium SURF_17]|uniref:Cation:proton antiporter n=1 Tax=Candidatus Abyssobacteria bacterium SURF_17 TaxID=2093361 RepID=A0A419F7S4_9BACT|nr:MAG: cation:proton antiporter [Candidatus Abyssubacteria bacterium SURF_17]
MSELTLTSAVVLSFLSVAFFLAFVRLLRGPTLPDRVVALDLIAVVGIGFVSAYAIASDQSILLNVASVMALIGFLGTVAFAYYLRRKA